jgi:hypothetical protein
VDYDYVEWWAKYVVLSDHNELFRAPLGDAEQQKRIHSFLEDEVAARDVTMLTLKAVKTDIANETKGKVQTSASP